MRRFTLFFLALFLMLPSIVLATSRAGTKKVGIVTSYVVPDDYSSPSAVHRRIATANKALLDISVTILEAHNVPYEIFYATESEAGWITRTGLDKASISSDIGIVLMLGGINGDPYNTTGTRFMGLAPLYEFWDSDSSSVPILNVFNPYYPWTGSGISSTETDIGMASAFDYPASPDAYRLDGNSDYAPSAKLHCGYTNRFGKWESLAWVDSTDYHGARYYAVLDSDPDWEDTNYGFTSTEAVIWLNGTPTSPTDSVIVWQVNRDQGAEPIIFANLGSEQVSSRNMYGMHLLLPLLLKLEPDLYYETLENIIILDDLGMAGKPGLAGDDSHRNGVTGEDIQALCEDFVEFGWKGTFAVSPDWLQWQPVNDQPEDYWYEQPLRTHNQALAQVQMASRYKNNFKILPVWHNHLRAVTKGVGNNADLSDTSMAWIYTTYKPIYEASLDSAGWKWGNELSRDINPIGCFAGDSYNNYENPADPDTEEDTWDTMLRVLVDSLGVKAVRAGSGWGPVVPGAAAAGKSTKHPESEMAGAGARMMTKYGLIVYSESFYADSQGGSTYGDSVFVNGTRSLTNIADGVGDSKSVDSLMVAMNIISNIRGNVGKDGGYWGTVYEYTGPKYDTEFGTVRKPGYKSNFKNPFETWHTYNWIPVVEPVSGETQRKGQEYARFIAAQLGFGHHIAGVNDIWAYTWGEKYLLMKQNFRNKFDIRRSR